MGANFLFDAAKMGINRYTTKKTIAKRQLEGVSSPAADGQRRNVPNLGTLERARSK